MKPKYGADPFPFAVDEIEEYHSAVYRLAKRNGKDLLPEKGLLLGALGISGEAGEVTDLIKKIIFHDKSLDKNQLIREMGDVLWYITHLCNVLNVTLYDVMDENLAKLKARFPNGTFDAEQSAAKADEK